METTNLFLGSLVDVMVDYGQTLDTSFKMELVKCSLVSSSQTFPLISVGTVNQVCGKRLNLNSYDPLLTT